MISTIKFRAWDREDKKYLYKIQDAFDMMSGRVEDSNGNDVLYDEECFGGFLENNRYVVEQYTGIKDVNGKEIYVGDIVQLIHVVKDSRYANGGWVSTVNKLFVVSDDNYVFNKWIARDIADCGFGVSDWSMGDELSIVGNLHCKVLEDE